jgi:hypothetical protein
VLAVVLFVTGLVAVVVAVAALAGPWWGLLLAGLLLAVLGVLTDVGARREASARLARERRS